MNLLVASTSSLHSKPYLSYLKEEVDSFFPKGNILFIPYARPGGMSWEDYTAKAAGVFSDWGYSLRGIHTFDDQAAAIAGADGIFTGGGNTFVLLKTLCDLKLIRALRDAVHSGTPYMGSSAGSNLTGLSIGTTNDMPIVHPPSFEALQFLPFNINPHYLDPDPKSTHMGETRETRIAEFLEFNGQPVIGLREGSWLRRSGSELLLKGELKARWFERGKAAVEMMPGDVSYLLGI